VGRYCKENAYQLRIKADGFRRPDPGLQSRNLDVAMAGITITDARKQVVDFSEGYYNADLLIAVKSTDNSIVKFSDLTGKKVGLKQGRRRPAL
jgi:ABC-type amino acid transport substrate-binding protein